MAEEQTIMTEEEVSSDDILRRAMEQPGVKEMMSVYQRWEHLHRMVQPYCRTTPIRKVVATADTTEPVRLHVFGR